MENREACLPACGVLGEEGFEFAVEAGSFQRGEVFVQQVVVLLRQQVPEPVGDALPDPDVHHPPVQLLDRGEPSPAAHEHSVRRDRRGLEQPVTRDGRRQGVDVAQVGAVPVADDDRGHRPLQLDMPAAHRPPPCFGAASETVSTRSSSCSSTGNVSPINNRSRMPRPALVAHRPGAGLPEQDPQQRRPGRAGEVEQGAGVLVAAQHLER